MTEKELKTCACGEDNCNCKEIAESELRRKLDLLLRTGSILMESAADTSRIMRTMKRAAAFLGLDERYMHLYINWNVLMVNYSDEEHSFSKFQRCEKHGISGCQGVSECMKAGSASAIAGLSERNEVSQAIRVATKAEIPMAT